MPRSGSVLLLDTSSAIAFLEMVDRADLLTDLIDMGHEIELPPAVIDELDDDDTIQKLDDLDGVIFLTAVPSSQVDDLKNRYPTLGSGEIAILVRGGVLSEKDVDYVCVLDDGRARNAAKRLDRSLTGTVGLLNALRDEGKITPKERDELLDCMIDAGFHYKRR